MLREQFELDVRQELSRRAQDVPEAVVSRVREHRYRPRRAGRSAVVRAAGVVVVVAAASAGAVLALATSSPGPAPWRLVSDLTGIWQGSVAPSLRAGVSLTCPGASTCYARVVPAPGPGSVTSTIAIEVTHDGGRRWREASLPASVDQASGQFGPIDCVDQDTCMTLVSTTTWHYEIARTTDGGRTWATDPGPAVHSTEFGVTGGISCVSTASCVVVGSYAVGTPEAGRFDAEVTADGGRSSTQVALPARVGGSVQCFDSGRCVAPAVYSTDAGRTWAPAAMPTVVSDGHGVWSMSCGDSADCVATVGLSDDVIVTTDGGQRWTQVVGAKLDAPGVSTVTCPTASTCWAAGASGEVVLSAPAGDPSRPALERTDDQGRTWQAASLPAGDGITGVGDVSCANVSSCFAIAQDSDGLVLLPSSPR